MTKGQTRNNHPVTITLSPAGAEGLERLQGEMEEPVRSRVIDRLIRAEMSRRGFTLRTSSNDMSSLFVATLFSGGVPLRHVLHQGVVYYEVPEQGTFTIRLNNRHSRRCLAVLGVDGMNVIDGSDASTSGQGWVLHAHQVAEIKGWLRDNNEAAAFRLQSVGGSYAEQMGKGKSNVGVIGLAVFHEKERLVKTSAGLWSGPALKASSRRVVRRRTQSVGTGYGEKVEQKTATTTFHRAETPCHVASIRYGTRADLISWGVPVESLSLSRTPLEPNPFPGDSAICPAPPGWQG